MVKHIRKTDQNRVGVGKPDTNLKIRCACAVLIFQEDGYIGFGGLKILTSDTCLLDNDSSLLCRAIIQFRLKIIGQ